MDGTQCTTAKINDRAEFGIKDKILILYNKK